MARFADVLTGQGRYLGAGDPLRAVLASMAIPAVFPVVEVDGVQLCDGGVADNAGIARAVALGADEIWVLPAGYSCALTSPPTSALATAGHAMSLLSHQRLVLEVAEYAPRVTVNVAPPLCPVRVSPVDFSRTAELVGRACSATQRWLLQDARTPADPPRALALHRHGRSDRLLGNSDRLGGALRPRPTPRQIGRLT